MRSLIITLLTCLCFASLAQSITVSNISAKFRGDEPGKILLKEGSTYYFVTKSMSGTGQDVRKLHKAGPETSKYKAIKLKIPGVKGANYEMISLDGKLFAMATSKTKSFDCYAQEFDKTTLMPKGTAKKLVSVSVGKMGQFYQYVMSPDGNKVAVVLGDKQAKREFKYTAHVFDSGWNELDRYPMSIEQSGQISMFLIRNILMAEGTFVNSSIHAQTRAMALGNDGSFYFAKANDMQTGKSTRSKSGLWSGKPYYLNTGNSTFSNVGQADLFMYHVNKDEGYFLEVK